MEFLVASDEDEDESSDSISNVRNNSNSEATIDANSSSTGSKEQSIRVAPIKSKWTELSDNEEDENCNNEDNKEDDNLTKGCFLKAEDLFSTVVAQFTASSGNYDKNIAIQTKTYIDPNPTAPNRGTISNSTPKTNNSSVPTGSVPSAPSSSSSAANVHESAQTMKITPLNSLNKDGTKIKGPTSKIATIPTKKEKDKDTGKDRVKKQRLAGQSGIGDDFKEWKSEEAMRQRQQYD